MAFHMPNTLFPVNIYLLANGSGTPRQGLQHAGPLFAVRVLRQPAEQRTMHRRVALRVLRVNDGVAPEPPDPRQERQRLPAARSPLLDTVCPNVCTIP